jgi:hypothetical protein
MKRRIGLIVLAAVAIAAMFREEGRLLLFGWALFVWHNMTRVTVNPSGVATGLIALVLLACATHYFARWWCRAVPRPADAPLRQWHFRWSLAVVLVLFLMFAVGFSAIGLARHIGWLISSPTPIYMEWVRWRHFE